MSCDFAESIKMKDVQSNPRIKKPMKKPISRTIVIVTSFDL